MDSGEWAQLAAVAGACGAALLLLARGRLLLLGGLTLLALAEAGLVADLSEREVIVAILKHLGLPSEPPPIARARSPNCQAA